MTVGRCLVQAVDKIMAQSYPHFGHSFQADLNTRRKFYKALKYKGKTRLC